MYKNHLYHETVVIVCTLRWLDIKRNLKDDLIYTLDQQCMRDKKTDNGNTKYWIGTYWSGLTVNAIEQAESKSDDFDSFLGALKEMEWVWQGQLEYVRPDFRDILWDEFVKYKSNSNGKVKEVLEKNKRHWEMVCGKIDEETYYLDD